MTKANNDTKSSHESNTGDSGGMSSVTRRLAMTMTITAAASTLVPRAAMASEPDPIHRAIADHAAALAALKAGLEVMYALEAELPNELRKSSINIWEEVIVETDDPRWIESERNVHALFEADEAAALGLINVVPTTLAGAADLMRYVAAIEERGHSWPDGLQDDDENPAKIGKAWEVYLHRNIAALFNSMPVTA